VSITAIALAAGVALDLALGDPEWMPHPVRAFGWLAGELERLWRATRLPLRIAGVLFWMSATAAAGWIVYATIRWLPHPWISIYWIYSLLAIRSLDVESMRVVRALARKDLTAARHFVSRIVGRDCDQLDEPEILRAALETVAENLSDGVIAPLFYLALGGPVAMAVYKAINTLDSMVGHKDETYRDFGWASARIDDAANFLPARLSAVLVWISAAMLGLNPRRAIRTTLRDARTQPSPNSGYPEAAFAGALGIRLGGLNFYRGVAGRKNYLGDAVHPIDAHRFQQARVLLYASSLLMALLAGAVIR
jgi:adenosylcobinamide-phosphate synthase